MKKLLFFVPIFIVFVISASGQTTLEEYNYITKGYKVQIESGLDMKKGYTIKDYGNWGLNHGEETRDIEFKGLYRTGQTKPCAIMLIYKRTDISSGVTWYICIPSNQSEDSIWELSLSFISENCKDNDALMQTFIYGLMKFTSGQLIN